MFVSDVGGSCVWVNKRWCELTGLTPEQALGDGWARALHPADAPRVRAEWARASAEGRGSLVEYRFVRPDGGIRWVEGSAAPVHDTEGELSGWVGSCVDLTARKLGEERYRDLFEHASDGIFTMSVDGTITSINTAGELLTGYAQDEIVGMSFFELIVPEDRERAVLVLQRRLGGGENEIVELELQSRDGRRTFVEINERVVEQDGTPVALEAIARDTTERHLLQQKLSDQARHDPLTGLANRTLLLDRLELALAGFRRTGDRVAVILMDLDNFKVINDTLGHAVGDQVLVAIAPRLLGELRSTDMVARLGGDEFAFLLEGVDRKEELVSVAERLLAAIGEPIMIGDRRHALSASLGVALAEPRDTAESLLGNADTAMYRAKGLRQHGRFELFDDTMRSRLERELAVTRALEEALDRDELEVHFQPIVAVADGTLLGLEALARWQHSEWGWVSPGEFIPLSEENGLIVPVGKRILELVARQASIWRAAHPESLPLGIFTNVSPRELCEESFVADFIEVIERHGLTTADIGVEVTEQAFIDRTNATLMDNITRLAELGVRISLDDFGTGYAALALLRRLPLSAVKIDRSFIHQIRGELESAPITEAVVGLGHTFNLTVIAEGVESPLQAACLRRLGCDAAQGIYFAQPAPAEHTTIT